MGPLCWLSDSGSGGTEGFEFIQSVDRRDPQMHEIWSIGSDGVTCEVHPTVQLDVGSATVGHFLADYLSENGHRIPFLARISINGIVKLLGIPDLHRTSGHRFTDNLLAPHDTTGWGGGGTS